MAVNKSTSHADMRLAARELEGLYFVCVAAFDALCVRLHCEVVLAKVIDSLRCINLLE